MILPYRTRDVTLLKLTTKTPTRTRLDGPSAVRLEVHALQCIILADRVLGTVDQQLDYLLFLSKTAHDLGLAMGLKNNPGLIKNRPIIVEETDFVLIEECAAYNECKAYQPYIDADKATWAVEYERSISCTIPGMQVTGYSR